MASDNTTGAVPRDRDFFQADFMGANVGGAHLRGAELSGSDLMLLANFTDIRITQSQQHNLLLGIGIDVYPEAD